MALNFQAARVVCTAANFKYVHSLLGISINNTVKRGRAKMRLRSKFLMFSICFQSL